MIWKKIKLYSVLTVIIGLAATAGYFYLTRGGSATVQRRVDPPAVVQQIQALSELVTVKYGVQKIIGLEEEKIPFGSEKLLLMVRAEVLAGIDLAHLSTNDVTLSSDQVVTVRLPSPTVLHVYLNEKDTQTWDRTKTWWTPWVDFNPDLERKARLAALEAVQAAALEMGILREAQDNAEMAISRVLAAGGVRDVRFAKGIEEFHGTADR